MSRGKEFKMGKKICVGEKNSSRGKNLSQVEKNLSWGGKKFRSGEIASHFTRTPVGFPPIDVLDVGKRGATRAIRI